MTNIHQNRTHDQIQRLIDRVLDLDLALDGARSTIDQELAEIRRLAALRNAAAQELASLVGQSAA